MNGAQTALAYIRRLYAVERELRTQCEGEWRELPLMDRAGRIAAERQDAFAAGAARVSRVAGRRIAQAVAEASRAPGDGLRAEPMDGADPLRRGRPLVDRQLGSRAGGARPDHWTPQLALPRKRTGRPSRGGSLQPDRLVPRHEIEPFAYLRDILTRLPALAAACHA